MARVAVVGPGAIGSVAALAVQQTGRHDAFLCGRRDPGTIRIVDEASGTTESLRLPTLTSATAVEGPADWVLLAVKTYQTPGTSDYLSALCDASTTVVALQNGVEHRQRVDPLAGGADVLPAIVWISAEPTAPGEVTVRPDIAPLLQVPSGEPGKRFAELMNGGWVRVELVDDFTTAMWRKLTTNAVGGLMAITARRAAIFQREDIVDLARRLARECLTVARAEGASIDDSEAEKLVGLFEAMAPETGSSILFDRLAGRQLEWDARNGVVRRLGLVHGIPTPVSDVLVPLLAAASDG
jgi:2-dehydropantoate 2-reductase